MVYDTASYACIFFSFSVSAGCLVGMASFALVGVEIECVGSCVSISHIAQRCFPSKRLRSYRVIQESCASGPSVIWKCIVNAS